MKPANLPCLVRCIGALLIPTALAARADVNSWTNPSSGNWDDPSSWSLGVRPTNSQSVMITNSNWKAVAINPSTPINFSNSMTVSNLTIRGATNTVNTLLLNFFGTAVPLTVLNGLTLQDDGRIVNFNSALVVQGGTITVTNSQIIQDGGFVRVTNAAMNLNNSEYDITNGVFEGGYVMVGAPIISHFNQFGGTVTITNLQFGLAPVASNGGSYALFGGNLNLPGGLMLFADNSATVSYFQAGGTNRTTEVVIEPGIFGASPGFTLNGGLLADNDVSLLADNFDTVTLEQNGGTHVVTNTLLIAGGASSGMTVLTATYILTGGATLSARLIDLDADAGDSIFVQSNGTVRAETFQAHSTGFFGLHNTGITLAGGTLSCSNFTTVDGGGRFNQSGGSLVVSNLLDFGGSRNVGPTIYGRYTFTGGTVAASNISITGDWIIGNSTTNRISNPGSCSLSHTLQISNAVEQLGRFILASNATIDLAGSASRLSFAFSGNESWNSSARLTISNWNGNATGGGAEQLKFGTNANGLTAAQLNQIRFINPAGFLPGLYLAQILNTGEVVPAPGPSLGQQLQGKNLVLTWPSGWTLQTATNILGSFVNLPGATSPFTNDTTSTPQRFFRLKQ